jgi:hypothetical protein
MSKLLIEANLFQKLLDAFFKAKAAGKEDQFISKLQHQDSDVGNAFNDLNQTQINNMVRLRQIAKRNGLSTIDIDNYLKKYADKV